MKCIVSFACVFSVLLAVSLAAPLGSGAEGSASLQASGNLLAGIDTTSLLQSASRIISLIRQFCPQLSEIIDNVIQSTTSQIFRIVGRQILQGGGLGGGSSSSGNSSSGSVSVVLPTFPPDEEDYDEDEGSDAVPSNTTTEDTKSNTNDNNEIAVNDFGSSVNSQNEISKRHVRRIREAEEEQDDQEVAASGGNGPEPADDLAAASAEDAERNKRFLPGADAHGGGSGNFLFDIIRGTADNAARAVGTVYRMVAGTENLGFGVTATSTKTVVPQVAGRAPAKLVAGSGATEEVDEKDHAGGVAEIDVAKADGYHEGIPGPITRLFVIANRGIANLVQDLILRLAQTSERIVNFKARLITSLI